MTSVSPHAPTRAEADETRCARRARPSGTAVVVALLVLIGTAIRLALAATTDGTNDVDTWLAFLDASGVVGSLDLYSVQSWPTVPVFDFNHGPLVAYAMPLARALVQAGVDARFLVRLPAIMADAATAFLVFHLVRERFDERLGALAVGAVALNPVLILVSGFHGNTDSVFVALLVATLALLWRERHAAAGATFALALGVKLVPLVVVPFVLWGQPTREARRRFVTTAALVSIPLWLPVLASGPHHIVREVFLYTGPATRWGFGQLLWVELSLDPSGPVRRLWAIAVVAAMWALAARVSRTEPRPLDWSFALGFLVFLFVSPAFGAQYLAWPVPFLALVGFRVSAAYALAASVHLYLRYAWWSGGLSLGHANGWTAPPNPTSVRLSEMVVWIVMVAIAIRLLRSPAWRHSDPGPRLRSRAVGPDPH